MYWGRCIPEGLMCVVKKKRTCAVENRETKDGMCSRCTAVCRDRRRRGGGKTRRKARQYNTRCFREKRLCSRERVYRTDDPVEGGILFANQMELGSQKGDKKGRKEEREKEERKRSSGKERKKTSVRERRGFGGGNSVDVPSQGRGQFKNII
ncbi:hypothetical protein BC939DRAFT_133454 [Gamsiella multidivaricata]|uniref:uncharacterized protein n=1 Tax=Gamsiella multidivaricata TaxID=101098 RepID=UPI0022205734|nr:uncharacterized protein BC939DRAFT_133454 [Gamsiella multidivaricata]KAI7825230.1 hypothetical protein BC939DRAFT_133454 [Gamsiella multidivaricata]